MIGRLIRTLGLAGLLGAALLLSSCDKYRQRSDWPEPSPAIWEVTSPSGQQGWIFGTVHALPRHFVWGTPLLDRTFANAGVLVVEVADLDTVDSQGIYNRLAHTPGQPPLTARVDPAEREDLRQLMQAAGVDDDDFADLETWAAALTLSGTVRLGDPLHGVDRALIAEADDLEGLETAQGQLAMFDHLSPAAQADLLEGVARSYAADQEEAMLLAWLTGDEDTLAANVNAAMHASPELERVLLDERNARWAERIAGLIDAGRKPFVGVGAGHVVGDDGLIALLSTRGFETRRIQ
ncbi:MAG: TraB/GumN family protein [Erythrobacter sp.]|nr:TraB/GumN family protein [Erythrobacter sp.]